MDVELCLLYVENEKFADSSFQHDSSVYTQRATRQYTRKYFSRDHIVLQRQKQRRGYIEASLV